MIRDTYISVLRSNVDILSDFVKKMSGEEIARKIKDFWSIYQHIEHLVESQYVILDRISLFLREDSPRIAPYTPIDTNEEVASDPRGDKSAEGLLDDFRKVRCDQIALIETADSGVWKKEGVHPEFAKYDFDILLRHAILHDGFHMWRMEELWIKKEDLIMELHSN